MGSDLSSIENSEMAQAMRLSSPHGASDSAGRDEETVPPDFLPRFLRGTYQYSPLPRISEDGDRFSIPLIRLLPGAWDSPIELELVAVPMEPGKIPYYEAVSYVWGSDWDRSVSVSRCKGCPMKIGRNAAMALRRFRRSDHTYSVSLFCRLLWVDAICINQEDAVEKNEQVSQRWIPSTKLQVKCCWCILEKRTTWAILQLTPPVVQPNLGSSRGGPCQDCIGHRWCQVRPLGLLPRLVDTQHVLARAQSRDTPSLPACHTAPAL
ncbi:hypothetical protein B0T21DRAFT_333291 [Apiosordaria backusii]|uniref:Heterokaryon incompatibility domain-containing protein n=1 Tax=Apiosordaria backusii TaxID=314023 RepID=A0AA40EGD9_9PEZI|nr:hypothetical protein B0T21DRAFT_333291 [Apiosordaria backusii]